MWHSTTNYIKWHYTKRVLSTMLSSDKMDFVPVLLIHGGAASISDAHKTGKVEGMKKALRTALPLLMPPDGSAGSALDAVEAAVRGMELDENFNAGYGACLNSEGNVELDASIMEGAKLRAGCVTLLQDIMHPVSVARRVMEQTNHTFLGGVGAKKFAVEQGFEEISLVTEDNRLALMKLIERQSSGLDTTSARTELDRIERGPGEMSTVGAVALDASGNFAAATSTGGMTGKVPGRIADSALLGCGTYADNMVGAVSCTGHGERIMRFNLAQKIIQKMHYEKLSAQEAIEVCCKEMTERLVSAGGAIAIGAKGDIGTYWTAHDKATFEWKRMVWAYIKGKDLVFGVDEDEIYREDA